jgi:hypothetical protein
MCHNFFFFWRLEPKSVEHSEDKTCGKMARTSESTFYSNQNWTRTTHQKGHRVNEPSTIMFSALGLFYNLACPRKDTCKRETCVFSHGTDLPPPPSLFVPVEEPKASTADSAHINNSTVVPAKRPAANPQPRTVSLSSTSSNANAIGEPPRKIQKLGLTQKRASLPAPSYTSVSAMLLHHFGVEYLPV